MAKFYQYKPVDKPTNYVHSPEDVRLDYFIHFWTVDSITQANLWNLPQTPWLDNKMYYWTLCSVADWELNNA